LENEKSAKKLAFILKLKSHKTFLHLWNIAFSDVQNWQICQHVSNNSSLTTPVHQALYNGIFIPFCGAL